MAKLIHRVGIWAALTFVTHAAITCNVLAQTNQDTKATTSQGIEELPSVTGSNQIPILNNRFRIDYEVKELTLVFFRKPGSPAVVLVKPDGSKIYSTTATANNVYWYSDKTYDLIRLKEPTPGPWQAVGKVLPESRIMVLTDINIKVDPLPKDLMLGEQLKVTATLVNGDKPIQTKDFRDLLQLKVLMLSTQKEGMANASETVFELATLDDDGNNFDERPRDAVFTGEYRFVMKAGEWMPKYTIKTPLYTRELIQDPIIVSEAPLAFEFVEGKGEQKHQLKYTITKGVIDPNSVMIQGRVIYPSGDVQTFTLAERKDAVRQLDIGNVGNGNYRVEHVVYGKTTSGRDFVLNLTDQVLRIIATQEPSPEPAAAEAPAKDVAKVPEKPAEPVPEPEPEFPLVWVIVGNLFILLGGGAAVYIAMNPEGFKGVSMLFKKLNPSSLLKKNKAAANDISMSDPSGQQVSVGADGAAAKKSAKIKESDDILDLSLPDD